MEGESHERRRRLEPKGILKRGADLNRRLLRTRGWGQKHGCSCRHSGMILPSAPTTPPLPERLRRCATPARLVPARHRRPAVASPNRDAVRPPADRDAPAPRRPDFTSSQPGLQRCIFVRPLLGRDRVDEVEFQGGHLELKFFLAQPPLPPEFAECVKFPPTARVRANRRFVSAPSEVKPPAPWLQHSAPSNPLLGADGFPSRLRSCL